jgi:hypothetical protein
MEGNAWARTPEGARAQTATKLRIVFLIVSRDFGKTTCRP